MTKPTKWCARPAKTPEDQPWHPPGLIRVFAVRLKKTWVLSYPLSAQRRLWSDWADAQADLSLRWAHSHFCFGFVMRRLSSLLLVKTIISRYSRGRKQCLMNIKTDAVALKSPS